MTTLDNLIQNNAYTSEFEICPGCENHCTVKLFHFQNGNTFFSGNNCEKVYSNTTEGTHKGVNMFAEKFRLLFNRSVDMPADAPTIGIPRGLGIYENYPFWHTLFTHCGFRVVLSQASTNRLYETGLHSIMADNICFPAKLMHGHILNLVERKVDRIFYPYVVYERKEDNHSRNSYNCPIVAGYADVIRSSMDPAVKYGIPFDSPVITFSSASLTHKSCAAYLKMLGVPAARAKEAVDAAIKAQNEYLSALTRRAADVLAAAEKENRMVIVLACRPYHIDPLIEHKISQAVSNMGVDVITENVAAVAGADVYGELNAVTQWSYPNRIFKAAYFVGKHTYRNLHFVQLTSFGCGPDAFILDEVNAILKRFVKNQTILKIDDVNNIGSLRLRVRSLIESVNTLPAASPLQPTHKAFETTSVFGENDRRRILLAPYFAEGYSEFLTTLFEVAGYQLVVLPPGTQQDAERGLQYANNDVCYPATIVIGSVMNALLSGRYDLDQVAVIMTQTGGQCRASNYFSLIKNAMVSAGMKDVPVISLALGNGVRNQQPGFVINWTKMARIVFNMILYADCLSKLFHATVVREKEPGRAAALYKIYTDKALPLISRRDCKGLQRLIGEAAAEFAALTDIERQVPVIGIVGEIYVKYNGFSNKYVVNWLEEHGVEVVMPALINFFTTNFVNYHVQKEQHLKESSLPLWLTDGLYKLMRTTMTKFDQACHVHPFYRPFSNIFEDAQLAQKVVHLAGDFGEGWDLPGEIRHLATHGVNNVVSLQPFGCIANHIISKGIEKKIKQIYPQLSLLFLDFDSSTSEANVFNRLHFMVENCKAKLKK
ncbi:MAG: 2-hydroxyacyl-CoA dehydratase [Bacteroidales bacterium]|nr:2-hydroxyacyl-CoA dehydratase [Bacteroidales bacterium]